MAEDAAGRGDPGESLRARIEDLRAERGALVPIDEIGEVVESLLASLEGDINAFDLRLYREVERLAGYVRAVKHELADLCPDELKEEFLPAAADELDAITRDTESATGRILDAAESLGGLAEGLDEARAGAITDSVTRIYEACNFQDITGQRITKVVTTLKHIEGELDRLVGVFGEGAPRRPPPPAREAGQADFLNGPQLPDQAATQDEIDALLASFD